VFILFFFLSIQSEAFGLNDSMMGTSSCGLQPSPGPQSRCLLAGMLVAGMPCLPVRVKARSKIKEIRNQRDEALWFSHQKGVADHGK
jgi:hypothetical protein